MLELIDVRSGQETNPRGGLLCTGLSRVVANAHHTPEEIQDAATKSADGADYIRFLGKVPNGNGETNHPFIVYKRL